MLHFQPTSTSIHARFRDYLKQPGFSLHDLMITLCVTSVLGVFAISTTGLVQETRMTAAVNQLMGTLSLARSEAIKRNASVTLCLVANESSSTCSTTGDWEQGWIVFDDKDGNGVLDDTAAAPDNETLIQRQQGLLGGYRLTEIANIKSIAFETVGAGAAPVTMKTFPPFTGEGKVVATLALPSFRIPEPMMPTCEVEPALP